MTPLEKMAQAIVAELPALGIPPEAAEIVARACLAALPGEGETDWDAAAKAFESAGMCEPCGTEPNDYHGAPTVCFCTHLGLYAAAPLLLARPLAENTRLREVLEALVEEKCDYMRRNSLGDPETQHNIKLARALLMEGGV